MSKTGGRGFLWWVVSCASVLCGLWGGVGGWAQTDAPVKEPPLPPPPRVEIEVQFFEELAQVLPLRGGWLPVYVELNSTDGSTSSVRIEGSVETGFPRLVKYRCVRQLDVSPGAPTRHWIYLRVSESEAGIHTARVRVIANGRPILEREWRGQTLMGTSSRVGVIVVGGALGDVTPWSGRLAATDGSRAQFNARAPQIEHAVESVRVERLPDNLRGYDACDVVIVQQPDESSLEPAQARALDVWVRLGGLVVVMPTGGSDAVFGNALVKGLLGDRIGPTVVDDKLEFGPLRAVDPAQTRWEASVGASAPWPGKSPLVGLDPVPAELGRGLRRIESVREVSPGTSQTRRLYMELPHGRGAIGILTFDSRAWLEDQRNHQLLRDLWGTLVRWRLERGASRLQRQWSQSRSDAVVRELRDESRDIGLSFLIGLIVVYLLLVGPVLYFYLKRRGRLLALVWAEPLVALVYVGVVFAVGYLTKGVLTKTEQWTLYKQIEGEPLGSRESYLSLFAADEGDYQVEAPTADFLMTVNAREGKQSPALVLTSDGRGRHVVEGFHLELWQQGFVISGEFLPFDADGVELTGLSHSREDSPDEFPDDFSGDSEPGPVRARNRLPYPIRSGIVFREPEAPLLLPPLAPGEEVELAVAAPEEGVHGEWTKELIQEILSKARLGYGVDGTRPRVMAILDRTVEDFRVDRPHTVKARTDVYLLLQGD